MLNQRLLLVASLALAACNNSSFTGSSGTTPPKPAVKPQSADAAKPALGANPSMPAAPNPSVKPGATPSDVVIPPDCGDAGATQARLLTPTIDVEAADAHLEYEIYRTDCDGVVQVFAADKILFDLDAWGAYTDIDATITQEGSTPLPTKMKLTIGSDLFGHTGDSWAHQETTEKVEVKGAAKSVRLRIDLAGRNLSPREMPTGGPAADGSVPIPTYLRFGDATPIQVDVKALNPGTEPPGASVR